MTDLIRATGIGKHLQHGVVSASTDTLSRAPEIWRGGDERDQRVAIAHHALEQGRTLVDLHTVIARGGRQKGVSVDGIEMSGVSSRLPALAVVRADMRAVQVRVEGRGEMRYTGTRRWSMKFPSTYRWAGTPSWCSAKAAAPVMPPDIRPSNPQDYLFLWEAHWTDLREARPPIHIDPALLEHVAGSLYRVVEVWDLTELEAAALR